MSDLIFWGSNLQRFLLEARSKSPALVTLDVKTKKLVLRVTSTDIIINKHGEFMFLVRASVQQVGLFARCKSINNLGSYVSVFASEEKRIIYDRIYLNAPYDYVDSNGETHTVTSPEKFGKFYGGV